MSRRFLLNNGRCPFERTFSRFWPLRSISLKKLGVWRSAHSLEVPVLLKFSEELLSMRPRLRACSRLNVSLNHVPVLSIHCETFQELLVFLVRPFTFVKVGIKTSTNRIFICWTFKIVALFVSCLIKLIAMLKFYFFHVLLPYHLCIMLQHHSHQFILLTGSD